MIDYLKNPIGAKKYIGTGSREIRIKYKNAQPEIIYGFDSNGNYFIWNNESNITWFYTTSWWGSTLYKYKLDNGIYLDKNTSEIVIGTNKYINTRGKKYYIVIIREDVI